MRRPSLLVPVLLVPALLGLTGCGAGAVDVGEVTARAERLLEEQVGGGAEAVVDCPGDLPAEVGSEMRCTATVTGVPDAYGVTVTVTSVEEDRATFDVVVDDQPSA